MPILLDMEQIWDSDIEFLFKLKAAWQTSNTDQIPKHLGR